MQRRNISSAPHLEGGGGKDPKTVDTTDRRDKAPPEQRPAKSTTSPTTPTRTSSNPERNYRSAALSAAEYAKVADKGHATTLRPVSSVLQDEESSGKPTFLDELYVKSSLLDQELRKTASLVKYLQAQKDLLAKKEKQLTHTSQTLSRQFQSLATMRHVAERSNKKEKARLQRQFFYLKNQAIANKKELALMEKRNTELSLKENHLAQREKEFQTRVAESQLLYEKKEKELQAAWKEEKEFAQANRIQKRKLDVQNASFALEQIAIQGRTEEDLKNFLRNKKDASVGKHDNDGWHLKLYSWKFKEDKQQLLREIPLSDVLRFFFPDEHGNWVCNFPFSFVLLVGKYFLQFQDRKKQKGKHPHKTSVIHRDDTDEKGEELAAATRPIINSTMGYERLI